MENPVILHEGKFLRLLKSGQWEYVERCGVQGAVALLTETEDEHFLFIEQHRIPLGTSVIEIPAGLYGDHECEETREQAALRELQEETGYTSDDLELLTTGPSSAGLTNEMVTYFIARNSRKIGEGGGVDDENITLHLVPISEAHNWLEDQSEEGKIIDPKIYTALYFWLHNILLDDDEDEV